MGGLWSFLAKPNNQKTLTWLGSGAVVVIAGLWTAFVYLFPAKKYDASPPPVCAQQGVAIGGAVSGSTITNTATGSSSTAQCVAPNETK
jgi:hypothetical protein